MNMTRNLSSFYSKGMQIMT